MSQPINDRTPSRVTTDCVMDAIRSYVLTSKSDHFTTIDIAKHMGSAEQPVRIAFSWLTRYRVIESIPGVRSKRYLGQPENPNKRRHADSYFASVYQIREPEGAVDFNALNRAFGFA